MKRKKATPFQKLEETIRIDKRYVKGLNRIVDRLSSERLSDAHEIIVRAKEIAAVRDRLAHAQRMLRALSTAVGIINAQRSELRKHVTKQGAYDPACGYCRAGMCAGGAHSSTWSNADAKLSPPLDSDYDPNCEQCRAGLRCFVLENMRALREGLLKRAKGEKS